jgi:hypothetical protein
MIRRGRVGVDVSHETARAGGCVVGFGGHAMGVSPVHWGNCDRGVCVAVVGRLVTGEVIWAARAG